MTIIICLIEFVNRKIEKINKIFAEKCKAWRIYIINKGKRGVINIFEKLLDLLYPQVCGICGKLNMKSLCNKCKVKLEKEFNFQTDNYEEDYSKNFIEHNYFFKYENLIRSQILALKFQEKPYIYKTIAYFIKNMQKSFEKLKKYDIIIIVPISKQRKRDRGYNQSELVAKEISRIIQVPIVKEILNKIKNTVPQSTLNRKQREENAKGVYKIKNIKKIIHKKILIIDDIYTTGNTVNECANILIQAGVKRANIGVLTIAKD